MSLGGASRNGTLLLATMVVVVRGAVRGAVSAAPAKDGRMAAAMEPTKATIVDSLDGRRDAVRECRVVGVRYCCVEKGWRFVSAFNRGEMESGAK